MRALLRDSYRPWAPAFRDARGLLGSTASGWAVAAIIAQLLGGIATVRLVGRMLSAADYGQASMAMAGVGLGTMLVIGPVLTVYGRICVGRSGDLTVYRSLWRDLTLAVVAAVVIYLGASLFAGAAGVDQRRLLLPATFLLCAQAAAGAAIAQLEAGRARRGVAVVTGAQRLAIPIVLAPLVLLGFSPAPAFVASQGLACIVAIVCGRWASEITTKTTVGVADARVRSAWATAVLWSPLTLANFCMWIMTTSDRFILGWYHPLSVVGAYTLNYGLWSLPFLAVNGWLETLTRPLVYASEERGEHGDSKSLTNRRVAAMLVVGTSGAVCLSLVGRPIALLLFEAEYWLGLSFVLILASGHVLMGVGYAYVSVLLARHESGSIARAAFVGAFTNVLLNLILVPRFAAMGAAVSTACAYAVWSGVLAWRVGRMSRPGGAR